MDENLKDIIRSYHRRGLSHKEIHFLLKIRHGQNYSFQYLKRKVMPRLDLNYRRGNRNLTDFDEVLDLIKVPIGFGI